MINAVIAAAILTGIGIAYAWLGWKRDKRAMQILEVRRETERIRRQVHALELRMSDLTNQTKLRDRVESMALGLTSIPSGAIQLVTDYPDAARR